jgi:heme/copper-type cytochrome/quinol oxidase subunit 2
LVAAKDTSNADLTIKATGYQWKWGYDYLKGEGEGVALPLYAQQRSSAKCPIAVRSTLLSTIIC